VERGNSVVWPQRRHRNRLEQTGRAILSGAREESCLAAVSSSKQIGAGRASDLQWSKARALSGRSVVIEADWSRQSERSSVEQGESVVWPQCRHRSRLEQTERAIFSGARGESYLGVDMYNIGIEDDRRISR